jgi:hypothetical protein
MKIKIDRDKIVPEVGYWLNTENIKKIENIKNSVYMGYWVTKSPSGNWNDIPVDVFYVENPDRSLGHSNYFGLFYREDKLYITNGLSCFEEPIINACITPDGTILVSRYRHDYVEHEGCMRDGGRDYIRSSGKGLPIIISVEDSDFYYEDKI